jgi:3-oxoacyl-[acyl-carrier-protein] synthase III
MYGKYDNIKICGIAAAVPERVLDNMQYIEELGDRRAKKQILYTGIRRRHCLMKGQTASDLSCYAAEKLLTKLGWDRNEIRVIVNVTQSADLHTPSTAMIIQKRLGIGQDCIAFDVNLGCSGYVSGLQIAAALLQSTGGRGLLLVADGRYTEFSKNVSTNSLLFGDGGAATALEVSEGNNLLYSQKTDGTRYDMLYTPHGGSTRMDGNGVLLFSLNEVCDSIKDMRRYYDIKEESIDFYILHQAQKMILDGIANECNIDPAKIPQSYEEYGNTSTATIPVTICSNIEKIQEKEHIKLYLCGFGIGLAWSSVVVELDSACICPLEETDYRYADL